MRVAGTDLGVSMKFNHQDVLLDSLPFPATPFPDNVQFHVQDEPPIHRASTEQIHRVVFLFATNCRRRNWVRRNNSPIDNITTFRGPNETLALDTLTRIEFALGQRLVFPVKSPAFVGFQPGLDKR